MAEALKDFFSASLVRSIGASMAAAHPAFPLRAFVRDASRGLDELELVARARHIADALATHLPPKYLDAVDVLVRSLGPEYDSDEVEGVAMSPFFYMPHAIFVATHGLEHFDASMRAQHEITRRFTAEFSIRPFLEKYPERTLRVLERWTRDGNAHVRRLVSEGTRPRLPWAPRVRFLETQPERALPLLEALKDDPSTYVRRSVANHLNDLSKMRPDLVRAVAKRWLTESSSPERRALVEHALRTCVKRGDREALALLGFGGKPKIAIEGISFSPKAVRIGERTRVEFTLRSRSRQPQSLVIDLVVHFVKKRGSGAKVFKLARRELAPGASTSIAKNVSLAVHTTRKPNPGTHRVDALVNGERHALGSFDVKPASRSS